MAVKRKETRSRKKLQAFLAKYAKNPARVQEAMTLLKPFFRNAERGTYPLAKGEKLDLAEAARAIATATGRKVGRIVVVSREHPFPIPKPGWMTEEAYQDLLWEGFPVLFWVSIVWDSQRPGKGLRGNIGDVLDGSVEDDLWDNFVSSLWSRLARTLHDDLKGSFWDRIDESDLWRCLEDGLFYFLAFAFLDDDANIKRLTPLIRLFPRAIPLGEKRDESGTWIVLVA
ncbi:MAG: hypothetical protein V1723_01495 [Candidatus Uhrbacteria bacterium]